ncbi:Kelch-like protein 1 [Nymphon striatum]|nr:Kelch-like protein 1 [Nymphon striatum]
MGSNSSRESSDRFQKKLEDILTFTKSNFLTDLTIVVRSCSNSASPRTFNVNKNVLACESSYFLVQVSQAYNAEATTIALMRPTLFLAVMFLAFHILSNLISAVAAPILMFLYFFREKFRENPRLNKIEIKAIRFETLDRVLGIAFSYIEDNLDIENVLGIRDLCLSFGQLEMVENCDEFIESHFDEVSKSQTFKQVKFKYLKKLLESDDLVVEDEKRIFEIVVQWIEVDIQNRKKKGQKLFKVVRFPLMPLEYLHQIQPHELIDNRKVCNKIVESIYYLHEKKFRVGQSILKMDDVNPREYINSCEDEENEEELNENLICIGGEDDELNKVKSIEICSDFGNTWNLFDEFDTGRVLFACCAYKSEQELLRAELSMREPRLTTDRSLDMYINDTQRCYFVTSVINGKQLCFRRLPAVQNKCFDDIILIGGSGAERLCTRYDPKNKTFTELEPLLLDERNMNHGFNNNKCDSAQTVSERQTSLTGSIAKGVYACKMDNLNNVSIIVSPSILLASWLTLCHTASGWVPWKWVRELTETSEITIEKSEHRKIKGDAKNGLRSNSCECYCPQDDSWRSLPKMKEERWFAGCCYDNNKFIYVVGGWDVRNEICLTSMERFDVENEQWSTLKSSIGVGRRGLTLTMFKNQMFLIGGSDNNKKKYKIIQKYDSILDSYLIRITLTESSLHRNLSRNHHHIQRHQLPVDLRYLHRCPLCHGKDQLV